jgi:hypothetical protein
MDTLTYEGTYNGWPVTYSRTYTNEGADIVTIDELQGATSFLEANGVKPRSAGVAVPQNMPVQQGSPAPQSYPQPQHGYAQPAQQQWQCPIHGAQKLKAGYGGRGTECSVTTTTQPAYLYRAWQGKQGQTMYTCDMKSA